jgi:hypothetical protein
MTKTVVSLTVALSLMPMMMAQPATRAKAKPKANTVTAEDIQALRDALAAQSNMLASQQQQIQELPVRVPLRRRAQFLLEESLLGRGLPQFSVTIEVGRKPALQAFGVEYGAMDHGNLGKRGNLGTDKVYPIFPKDADMRSGQAPYAFIAG